MLGDASASVLYRLEARSDGYTSLDRVGELTTDGTAPEVRPDPSGGRWLVKSAGHQWTLDPDLAVLTPIASPFPGVAP